MGVFSYPLTSFPTSLCCHSVFKMYQGIPENAPINRFNLRTLATMHLGTPIAS